MFSGVCEKRQASGQLTEDSLQASVLPEHNMVKFGHSSCLFPIKPIRKLDESHIFYNAISEGESNPLSLFVLKSEAATCLHFLFPRHSLSGRVPSLCQQHQMCVTFLVSPPGRRRWQHKALVAENNLNIDEGSTLRNPRMEDPIAILPGNQALLWSHRE